MGASASFRGAPETLPDPQPNGRIEKSVSLRAEAKNESTTADSKDTKSLKEPAPGVRRMSLQELMAPANPYSPREEYVSVFNTEKLTVGDIVRVTHEGKESEGIVVEKVDNLALRVDFGERVQECLISECIILVRNYEFEVGDKVEARPAGMNLFFVGKVVKIYPDKSMDILMDGEDLSDIERGITPDNCRKLMSRRSVVINRWKRAFMMVVAANFFKRISFVSGRDRPNNISPAKVMSKRMSITEMVDDEDEKFSI